MCGAGFPKVEGKISLSEKTVFPFNFKPQIRHCEITHRSLTGCFVCLQATRPGQQRSNRLLFASFEKVMLFGSRCPLDVLAIHCLG